MQGMRGLTKKDILELVEKNFPDSYESDIIATFFYCNDGREGAQQQCILFRKELENK